MAVGVLPSVPEEQMTWRARAYLVIAAARHILVGAACIVLVADFDGDSFQVIRAVLPVWVWGVAFLVGGAHLTYAAIRGSEGHARVALSLSAISTSVWAAGFLLAYQEGGAVSPIGVIFATALTAKDLVICRQPMRSPFEPIVREYDEPKGR